MKKQKDQNNAQNNVGNSQPGSKSKDGKGDCHGEGCDKTDDCK